MVEEERWSKRPEKEAEEVGKQVLREINKR